jgi:hypothetical protein
MSGHSHLDGICSIPAIPNARNVPVLLCQAGFNEASLPGGLPPSLKVTKEGGSLLVSRSGLLDEKEELDAVLIVFFV